MAERVRECRMNSEKPGTSKAVSKVETFNSFMAERVRECLMNSEKPGTSKAVSKVSVVCQQTLGLFPCSCVLSCVLTPFDPVDCSPPGSSVHGILQARVLGGLPFPTSRELFCPWIELMSLASPALAGRLYHCAIYLTVNNAAVNMGV